MAAFLCTVQYESKGHELLLEVWLENDKRIGTTSREEVEAALRQAAASGVAPEGWRIGVMNWSHPRSQHSASGAEQLARFDSLIRAADISMEERQRMPRPRPRDEEEGEE